MEYVLIVVLLINGVKENYVVETGLTDVKCSEIVRQNPGVEMFCVVDVSQLP